MLSCKEATRLVSEGLDRELPFWRRMSLRFHVVMCRGCSRYKRQITALNSLVTDHYGDAPLRRFPNTFRRTPCSTSNHRSAMSCPVQTARAGSKAFGTPHD